MLKQQSDSCCRGINGEINGEINEEINGEIKEM
jgi:hypothetical protein